jgi:hypothetical protein
VPEGVEVVGGDATDEAFTREASEGASVRRWGIVAWITNRRSDA